MDENIQNYSIDTKFDYMNNNVEIIRNTCLFLVSFIVVVTICYILYKSIDNFISF